MPKPSLVIPLKLTAPQVGLLLANLVIFREEWEEADTSIGPATAKLAAASLKLEHRMRKQIEAAIGELRAEILLDKAQDLQDESAREESESDVPTGLDVRRFMGSGNQE